MDVSLKQAIADELAVSPTQLASDTVLDDLENWDSVTALTIMVLLSDALGRPVTPARMANLKTFGDIDTLVSGTAGG